MAKPPLTHQVRYLKNEAGETCEVVVSVELWRKLASQLRDSVSGLAWVDEYEPNSQILEDLQVSFGEMARGETRPVSELWDDLDE
ncbi:hypothetical protein CKA32_002306 [Geitlerinema sp. FC II]|nr:hypothetical protein CKA32_002306 [Geitlerinema sp. FC II]